MDTSESHRQGVPARMAIRGHPVHPALIPFPIAFLTAALVTDLVFWKTRSPLWAGCSFWLLVAGVGMGLVAAIAGLIDFVSVSRARQHAAGWIHALGNVTVLLLGSVNLVVRWSDATRILPWGLALSAIIALLLGVTGWFGGELVFRHMIGVTGHDDHQP